MINLELFHREELSLYCGRVVDWWRVECVAILPLWCGRIGVCLYRQLVKD